MSLGGGHSYSHHHRCLVELTLQKTSSYWKHMPKEFQGGSELNEAYEIATYKIEGNTGSHDGACLSWFFYCCEETVWPWQPLFKKKSLIGGWHTIQRFSPSSFWWEAWQCVGRHGAGKIAESSTSGSETAGRDTGLVWVSETSKSTLTDILPLIRSHPPQQGFTS